MTPARQRAVWRGIAAERLAAWLLRVKGYRILAHRLKTPGGEVDLVARRGGVLVFVEVKARPTLDEALLAIHPAQQRRIVAAARAWLSRHPADGRRILRFDAVCVAPGRWPLHVVNAFEAV